VIGKKASDVETAGLKLTKERNGRNGKKGPLAFDPLTPITSHQPASHEHFVQFYENDRLILDSISQFLATGFARGEAAIVAASRSHIESLHPLLTAQGLNVCGLIDSEQYLPLDAEDALAHFVVDGRVSETRFKELMKGELERLATGGRQVRVFGELVALLCAAGNVQGALDLERLWTKLQESHSFSLFCAYPLAQFARRELHDAFADVCATHSRIIPAESFTTLEPEQQTLAIAVLQQKAQALESEVSERAKVEENLRAVLLREQLARSEAETANRMKDEFLATVSHELRTPLNAIIGWLHMLRRVHLDEETKIRALETIERNAKSQAQLVEDLLDVSRMISGKLRLQVGVVDTASVINAAIDAVQLAANSKGIELQVTLDPSSRHVLGDASRLQQIVWNLLSNAIKFTPADGRVTVQLERVQSHMEIKVSDTGQGISQQFLPYVFERFCQADGGSTRRHGGLGLGLALVRHLVELHGGSVRATSDGEGKGATFIIELPLAPSDRGTSAKTTIQSTRELPSQAKELSDDVPKVTLLTGRRVLVVDDDADTLQMLRVMLSERKAEVQAATSADEAMEILKWYQPHVLVLDLAMPGEDGYSLIERIRRDEEAVWRRVPAVALTAQVRVEDRARALSVGFNMFVPKPVEVDELITAIDGLAENPC
jgi:signal transduction histidine kinase/ActR/RegA family two-component response regulator